MKVRYSKREFGSDWEGKKAMRHSPPINLENGPSKAV